MQDRIPPEFFYFSIYVLFRRCFLDTPSMAGTSVALSFVAISISMVVFGFGREGRAVSQEWMT